ncbi:MAG: hypothetical protein F4147_12310 [Gammaproteobacteria bacterium]|nr:hypothetical protein [Gammaproteobacteria bacterium]
MKRASRHARTGKPAAGGKNKCYFPDVDKGGHRHFTQIKMPDAPASVKAIERRGPDCYIAHTPKGKTQHPDLRAALKAVYPALCGVTH